MNDLIQDPNVLGGITNILLAVISIVFALIGRYVIPVANSYTAKIGIEIEEKHMRTLHSAAETYAINLVNRGFTQANDEAMNGFQDYAKKSVPDAIRALTPGPDVMKRLLTRYITQRLSA